MAKKVKALAAAALVLTGIFAGIYRLSTLDVFLSLAITFGTTTYHFCMRLFVGGAYDLLMKNHADYHKKWYQVSAAEQKLYEKLNVQRWKAKLPSYDEKKFDFRKHSWNEIVQAMCQAELVHETIVVFSFLPIAAHRWFGALPVFVITSILAAAFDMMFVMMQRYNRPRLIKLLERKRQFNDIQKNHERRV